ncbi:MAG: glucose-1-phosphate thymidylyltransferase RfbA [Acidimicrobiia bacterium]|nr:glucose-1-phosphate thymidylyltransferase RfbA [Acidimicrobiia bacterium]
MKGIVLAGGSGTRLDPITRVASKQLQPVYDKPMVYYPLATLFDLGISEILIISTPADLPRFESLLGDGSQWGASIGYAEQPSPRGIAEALLIGEQFMDGESVALILGDNIFYGDLGLSRVLGEFSSGAVVLAYPVVNPSRYGVIEIVDGVVVAVEEKPSQPRSNLAVPGFYIFDRKAPSIVGDMQPSARGELEITDLIRAYLDLGELVALQLSRGVAWLDSGTHDSLLEASNFVATVERRQGMKIACLEEIALEQGFVSWTHLQALVDGMPESGYRQYIERVLAEHRLRA